MSPLCKASLLFAGFLLLLGTAQRAHADTFNIAWDGTYGAGNAVLTATNEGSGDFLVTNITGSQNGTMISGLLAPKAFVNDNLIFPTATPQLDSFGVSFNEGATEFNLFFFSSSYFECSSNVCSSVATSSLSTPLTSFSITPAPEPSSLILLLVGLAGLVALSLRKSSKKVVTNA